MSQNLWGVAVGNQYFQRLGIKGFFYVLTAKKRSGDSKPVVQPAFGQKLGRDIIIRATLDRLRVDQFVWTPY
ncbi:hypothetical protein Lal_00015664 [Lupinus albus]|nr:hypothetical protein Lal_00015664 [Lupinus albus]